MIYYLCFFLQSFFPAMTKIVGTLGPKSRSVETISGCLKAGMSGMFLFPFSNFTKLCSVLRQTRFSKAVEFLLKNWWKGYVWWMVMYFGFSDDVFCCMQWLVLTFPGITPSITRKLWRIWRLLSRVLRSSVLWVLSLLLCCFTLYLFCYLGTRETSLFHVENVTERRQT